MCTAITYRTKDHYFGRNLDLECAFREAVTVTPRHFPFHFQKEDPLTAHFAIIGIRKYMQKKKAQNAVAAEQTEETAEIQTDNE